jgi:2OG-Fe(II) oxygenase superfamily
MNNIKVIPNFISDIDIKKAVDCLLNLKLYPFKNNELVKIIPLRKEELSTKIIKQYSDKVLIEHGVNQLFTVEGFLSLWDIGASAPLHVDNHYNFEYLTHSTIIYLNDDYEGGEIYFPTFDFEYKPKRGDAILFPCDSLAYTHGVKEVTQGKRMTIAMWHSPIKEKEHPLFR